MRSFLSALALLGAISLTPAQMDISISGDDPLVVAQQAPTPGPSAPTIGPSAPRGR